MPTTTNPSSRTEIEALLQLISSATQEAMSEYEKTGHGIPFPGSTESHPLDNDPSALALRRAVRTLEGACERLCTTLAQPMHTLINRSMPYEAPCLKLVAEGKICDIIETAPKGQGMHINEIATKANLAPDKLSQVMLLLATRGCFTEEPLQFVSMIPEALVHPEYAFSRAVDRSSCSFMIRKEMENASYFDWLKANPSAGKRFQRAMTGLSTIVGAVDTVVQIYPWENLTPQKSKNKISFCDVGSGPGSVALSLSKRFAAATHKFRFVLQDLPEPLEHAKTASLFSLGQGLKVWRAEHPEADVGFVPVNFLKEQVVQGQDIYFLSYITHNWPDSDAITVLKNVASAMNDTSRVLLHEFVLQHPYNDPTDATDARSPLNETVNLQKTFNLHKILTTPPSGLMTKKAPAPLLPNYGSGCVMPYNMNVLMLALNNSHERTSEDFAALGQHAGLRLVEIWPLAQMSLVEFRLENVHKL
ncbi:S-adenosyl-L-methionine-dependent methyltransferase [Marasmius fiardii PR-910]|nr:S-adenosyl-L-methionine-dependent methyltransferase [Marasmius fiardii PR-910]